MLCAVYVLVFEGEKKKHGMYGWQEKNEWVCTVCNEEKNIIDFYIFLTQQIHRWRKKNWMKIEWMRKRNRDKDGNRLRKKVYERSI